MDLKDKWRNLVRSGGVTANDLAVAEAAERRLRELRVRPRQGRPSRRSSLGSPIREGESEEEEAEAVEEADSEEDEEGGEDEEEAPQARSGLKTRGQRKAAAVAAAQLSPVSGSRHGRSRKGQARKKQRQAVDGDEED